MSARILVLGASGMLGSTLMRRLPAFNCEVTGTIRGKGSKNIIGGVDAYKIETIEAAIGKVKPNVVVNCIGVIRQRPDGQDPLTCITLNSLFPHQLANVCSEGKIRVVHISTDCVFSGQKGAPYLETDFADAHDIYGRTKFLGELHGKNCVTLRTSIIGHEIRGGLSLLEWFLAQKTSVKGFTRAIYSGLPTTELARVIGEYVLPRFELEGLYHVSSEPISKYELLSKVNEIYHCGTTIYPEDKVTENKSLDSSSFRTVTGWRPPSWSEMILNMYEDHRSATHL